MALLRLPLAPLSTDRRPGLQRIAVEMPLVSGEPRRELPQGVLVATAKAGPCEPLLLPQSLQAFVDPQDVIEVGRCSDSEVVESPEDAGLSRCDRRLADLQLLALVLAPALDQGAELL